MGGLKVVLWRTRSKFRIVTYHRFAPHFFPQGPEILYEQCRFLKQSFEVLPLQEIARCLTSGAKIPDRALAVTIDDGYRDFLDYAFPVFQKTGIPATVFLITGFLDRKLWPWWNQVEYATLHSRKRLVELPQQVFSLDDDARRRQTSSALCEWLVKIPNSGRLAFLKRIPELFEMEIPEEPPPQYAPMSWDEVRSLEQQGIEFGAHTETHPVLPSIEDRDQLRAEILVSKARVDAELGRPTRHFCYPNGDLNEATLQIVKEAGFETAVTTRAGLNDSHTERYRLMRLGLDPDSAGLYFREQVLGLHA